MKKNTRSEFFALCGVRGVGQMVQLQRPRLRRPWKRSGLSATPPARQHPFARITEAAYAVVCTSWVFRACCAAHTQVQRVWETFWSEEDDDPDVRADELEKGLAHPLLRLIARRVPADLEAGGVFAQGRRRAWVTSMVMRAQRHGLFEFCWRK